MDRTKKNIIVLTNLSRQLEADFFAYEVKALQTDIFLEDDQALLPHLASLI